MYDGGCGSVVEYRYIFYHSTYIVYKLYAYLNRLFNNIRFIQLPTQPIVYVYWFSEIGLSFRYQFKGQTQITFSSVFDMQIYNNN